MCNAGVGKQLNFTADWLWEKQEMEESKITLKLCGTKREEINVFQLQGGKEN